MEDISIFTNKELTPTERDLADNLGSTYQIWKQINKLVLQKEPFAKGEWNYPGKKYGWSFRIKDKKRAIIYLLPRDRYFKVAFVFGDKAVTEIIQSNIPDDIKEKITSAKKYAEGRGIRIEVKNDSILPDVEKLIDIKRKY